MSLGTGFRQSCPQVGGTIDPSLEKGESSWIGGWIVERVNVPYVMIAQLHLGSIF